MRARRAPLVSLRRRPQTRPIETFIVVGERPPSRGPKWTCWTSFRSAMQILAVLFVDDITGRCEETNERLLWFLEAESASVAN